MNLVYLIKIFKSLWSILNSFHTLHSVFDVFNKGQPCLICKRHHSFFLFQSSNLLHFGSGIKSLTLAIKSNNTYVCITFLILLENVCRLVDTFHFLYEGKKELLFRLNINLLTDIVLISKHWYVYPLTNT